MRPEITAFRELDTLVRNLTEQLAGYRKRALTAEGKCRDLESALAERTAEREQLTTALDAAERARDNAEAVLAAMPPMDSGKGGSSPGNKPKDPKVAELERENAELQERLEQARERATVVVDRVRFLRQQMTADK